MGQQKLVTPTTRMHRGGFNTENNTTTTTETRTLVPQLPIQQHQCQYDPVKLKQAQKTAAGLRSECDNLKGAPKSSKDDPNFVESYYKSSRLHFIGRWKARLESLMTQQLADSPHPTPYQQQQQQRVIVHVDMDCFFASVTEASNPVFKDLPLAICHSASSKGTGEVSAANYEARKYGISAGMFISKAIELCPYLIVAPYDFTAYEEVSEKVYKIFLKTTAAVQPLSCDEAYLDITGLGDDAERVVAGMRAEIEEQTGCNASAGIGPNMLLARLATTKAKPNGQMRLLPDSQASRVFLTSLQATELPGVGWATSKRLQQLGVASIGDLALLSKDTLQHELGKSAGALLYDYARGKDPRRVEPPKARKSVGAEVNWGVRFTNENDPKDFLKNIAEEVAKRMEAASGGARGRTVTLKLLRRKQGAGEPRKYLGCGECDAVSRSVTLATAIHSAGDLYEKGCQLLDMLKVPFDEIRGVGLTVTKLDGIDGSPLEKGGGGGAEKRMRTSALLAAFAGQIAKNNKKREDNEETEMQPNNTTINTNDSGNDSWENDEDGDTDGDNTSSNTKEAILKKYKGMTLSQIDAAALAELPFDIQVALIENLPKSRIKQPQNGKKSPDDEKGKWGATMTSAVGADHPSPSSKQQLLQQKHKQQQSIITTTKATASFKSPSHSPSPSAYQPLPSLEELDPSVLDALPLGLKRELELAYGINKSIKKKSHQGGNHPNTKRPAPFHHHHHHHHHASIATNHPAKQRKIMDAFRAGSAEPSPSAAAGLGPSTLFGSVDKNRTMMTMSMSQIDPNVLKELPEEMQREIQRQIKSHTLLWGHKKKKKRKGAEGWDADLADTRRQMQQQQQQQHVAGAMTQVDGQVVEVQEEGTVDNGITHITGTVVTKHDIPPSIKKLNEKWSSPLHSSTNIASSLSKCLEDLEVEICYDDDASVEAMHTGFALLTTTLLTFIKPLVASNLEQLRIELRGLGRLGGTRPWFASHADDMIKRVQAKVVTRYGWPLRLHMQRNNNNVLVDL